MLHHATLLHRKVLAAPASWAGSTPSIFQFSRVSKKIKRRNTVVPDFKVHVEVVVNVHSDLVYFSMIPLQSLDVLNPREPVRFG